MNEELRRIEAELLYRHKKRLYYAKAFTILSVMFVAFYFNSLLLEANVDLSNTGAENTLGGETISGIAGFFSIVNVFVLTPVYAVITLITAGILIWRLPKRTMPRPPDFPQMLGRTEKNEYGCYHIKRVVSGKPEDLAVFSAKVNTPGGKDGFLSK